MTTATATQGTALTLAGIVAETAKEVLESTDHAALESLTTAGEGYYEETVEGSFWTHGLNAIGFKATVRWRAESHRNTLPDPWCEEEFLTIEDVEIEMADIEAEGPCGENLLEGGLKAEAMSGINNYVNRY